MEYIWRNIGIYEHERDRVMYLWGLRIVFEVGHMFVWTAIMAIFVQEVGIAYLPLMLGGSALFFLVGSVVSHAPFLRLSNDRFMLFMIFMSLATLAGAYFVQANPWIFLLFVLLAKDFFFSQVRIALYRKNESYFSPAQAQRTIPVLDTALTIGIIAGATLFLILLEFFSLEGIIFLWSIPLVILGILIMSAKKLVGELPRLHREDEVESPKKIRLFASLKEVGKLPFILLIGLVVLLESMMMTGTEIQFLHDLEHHHATKQTENHLAKIQHMLQASAFDDAFEVVEEAVEEVHEVAKEAHEHVEELTSHLYARKTLAHDLGVFSLLVGIFALFIQIWFTPRLLQHIGLIHSMSLYFCLFFVLVLLFGIGLLSGEMLKAYTHGAHALFICAFHLSFYSFLSDNRETIRHILEGMIKPLGVMASSALAWFLAPLLPDFAGFTSILLLLLTALTAFICLLMKDHYTGLSRKNLKNPRTLSEKMHAIEVLSQKGHHKENAHQSLLSELQKQDQHPVVRHKIITMLGRLDNPRTVHTYLQILSDEHEDEETKIRVLNSLLEFRSLRTYWQQHVFGQHRLIQTLRDLLHDESAHPHIRKLVVMNTFLHLPSHEIAPFFLEMIEHNDEKLRSICLRSCKNIIHDPELAFYLRPFLSHKSSRLRTHAIIALWDFEDKTMMRGILQNLLESHDPENLIAAIYAIGEVEDKTFHEEILTLTQHECPAVRQHAYVALAKLQDKLAIPGLLEFLFGADEAVAQTTFHMLQRVHPDIRSAMKRHIQQEVSRRVWHILMTQNIKKPEHLQSVPTKILERLKRLYRLAEAYDDLLILEQVRPAS